MKQTLIFIIALYQAFSPIRGHCRFYPTCSTYAKNVINEYGAFKGSWLVLLRILSCQPFEVQSAKFINKIQTFNF